MTNDEGPDDAGRVETADFLLRLRQVGITDRRVLAAFESVPRHMFVSPECRAGAYRERALPIDCGQTISAPQVVGMMTMALELDPRDRVLEVGTGSGYQAAILSRLCRRVYTIDRFRTLVAAAEKRFESLRIANVTTLVGDGMKGWPEQAPFDKIIVTAAAEAVPETLKEQLRVGGIMVVPVGPHEGVQRLLKMVRTEDGFEESALADVRFVPLIPGRAERL